MSVGDATSKQRYMGHLAKETSLRILDTKVSVDTIVQLSYSLTHGQIAIVQDARSIALRGLSL
jgi:hypothetical protein